MLNVSRTGKPATVAGAAWFLRSGRDRVILPLAALCCLACTAAVLLVRYAPTAAGQPAAPETFAVNIRVDAGQSLGELKPIWRFWGADEPNFAYMKDGKKLLEELGEMKPKEVYFRTHNLMNTGDGTPALKWGSTNMYREDDQGNPIYDWTIVDRIFDAYLSSGIRPYVEVGFMPEALSTRPQPYQHSWGSGGRNNSLFTGWSYPPKDYDKWGEVVYQWAKHCVDKYGMEEVQQWYWEIWNEANIQYWQGSQEEFFKLHDYAVAAIRRAIPTARVGGPDKAGGGDQWLQRFLEHVSTGTNYATGGTGTPTDFLSFHAKGSPRNVNGHILMGISNQLRDMDRGFATIAQYPALRELPIVIGESDPEGCAACQGPQVAYRNGTMYAAYTAASFARARDLAARHGVNFEGALSWAFEFEGYPYFAGYRAMASRGLDKPVLNVFRMMSKMSGDRVAVESDGAVALDDMLRGGVRGERADVSALASVGGSTVSVMVWHYHDEDLPGPAAAVKLDLSGLPFADGQATLTHYRIDEEHSNAYNAWLAMGSPDEPTPEQYAQLDAIDGLQTLGDAAAVAIKGGAATIEFVLPRKGVSLLQLRQGDR